MALTVKDTLELENLRSFRLVAGEGGLEREVVRTGIVDFEFMPEINLDRPVVFDRDSFVISSLLFAKENAEVLYNAVQNLIDMGVSALAYKNIFFRELPKKVIDLANNNNFAIFVFGDSAYFEDIIADLSLAIREESQLTVMELKLREITKQEHSREMISMISDRLFPKFKSGLVVFYCVSKLKNEELDVDRIVRNYGLNGNRQTEIAIARYGTAMMVLISAESHNIGRFKDRFYDVLATCGLSIAAFICGYSSVKSRQKELDFAIREAIHSQKAAGLMEKTFVCFSEIGAYQFLLPYEDRYYLEQFMYEYMGDLLNEDTDANYELLKTAIAFVQSGGRLKETATRLFIHENTARYRMNKLRERLAQDKSEHEFFADLSLAVKIYRIRKLNEK